MPLLSNAAQLWDSILLVCFFAVVILAAVWGLMVPKNGVSVVPVPAESQGYKEGPEGKTWEAADEEPDEPDLADLSEQPDETPPVADDDSATHPALGMDTTHVPVVNLLQPYDATIYAYHEEDEIYHHLIKRIDVLATLLEAFKRPNPQLNPAQQIYTIREDLISLLGQYGVEPIKVKAGTPVDLEMRRHVKVSRVENEESGGPIVVGELLSVGYHLIDVETGERVRVLRKPEVTLMASPATPLQEKRSSTDELNPDGARLAAHAA